MGFIAQEELNDIRSKANIIDIIGSYLPLTQRGKNYFSVCPFHDDHAPSMSISPDKQIYKCFSCGASGNVFTFVQNYENISFTEAVKRVADTVGISINASIEPKFENKFKEDFEIMDLANKFYQNNLKTSLGTIAKKYLANRGINDEIVQEFEIGLSLDERDSLTKLLLKKDYNKEKLELLGLSNIKDNNIYDIFTKRIMFPLHDPFGKVIAFSGRIYKTEDNSKYINTKETNIFKKGHILFNYHNAKDHTRLNKQLIIVEGQMDAIRLSVNGIKNVVALMGTSLTKEQISLIKKLRCNVILCLDNDEAGEKATNSIGIELSKNNLETFVIRLADANDPDEYIINKGIDAFNDNLKNPLKYFDFHLNYLKNNKNLNKADDLAKYINEVLNSLEDSKDEILKEITINNLSKEYNVSIETLKTKLDQIADLLPVIKVTPLEKHIKKNKYEIAAEKILYFMINDEIYIRMYKKNLGYFDNKIYRFIANEILYYYKLNNNINIADFITFVSEKNDIKEKVMEIINYSNEEEINESVFEDYIKAIKEETYLNEIKEIKNELKNELDENKKIELITRLTELKKEV